MAKYIALFVLFIAMTNALHHQGDFLRARIRGNNYLLLTQCSFCPEVNFGTTLQPKMITLNVFVGENSTKTGSQWQLQSIGGAYVRIKNLASGRYLAWCQSQCKMSQPITVISKDGTLPQVKFQLVIRDDNLIAFKASNGKYLGYCDGCLTGGMLAYNGVKYIAFANKDDKNDPWAGFTLENL